MSITVNWIRARQYDRILTEAISGGRGLTDSSDWDILDGAGATRGSFQLNGWYVIIFWCAVESVI